MNFKKTYLVTTDTLFLSTFTGVVGIVFAIWIRHHSHNPECSNILIGVAFGWLFRGLADIIQTYLEV